MSKPSEDLVDEVSRRRHEHLRALAYYVVDHLASGKVRDGNGCWYSIAIGVRAETSKIAEYLRLPPINPDNRKLELQVRDEYVEDLWQQLPAFMRMHMKIPAYGDK